MCLYLSDVLTVATMTNSIFAMAVIDFCVLKYGASFFHVCGCIGILEIHGMTIGVANETLNIKSLDHCACV